MNFYYEKNIDSDAESNVRFRERLLRSAGPKSFNRFLKRSADYVECVAREAEYRERGEVLDIETFQHLRRENSAVTVCFGLLEYTLGIDLPDHVFENDIFLKLYWDAVDMVCWANVNSGFIMVFYAGALNNF
jgi:hypothetical protein